MRSGAIRFLKINLFQDSFRLTEKTVKIAQRLLIYPTLSLISYKIY